jgi:hypothetical protein
MKPDADVRCRFHRVETPTNVVARMYRGEELFRVELGFSPLAPYVEAAGRWGDAGDSIQDGLRVTAPLLGPIRRILYAPRTGVTYTARVPVTVSIKICRLSNAARIRRTSGTTLDTPRDPALPVLQATHRWELRDSTG